MRQHDSVHRRFFHRCLSGRVDLGLNPCLHNIEGACNHTGKATSGSASEKLQRQSDISTLLPLSGPYLALLVECKLQR